MPIAPVVKEVVAWLVATFGRDVLAVAMERLKYIWRRLFAGKNILILGPPQSGKSALVWFLTVGTPYKVIKGAKVSPDPTKGAVIIDAKSSPDKRHVLKVQKDVEGEDRSLWATLIRSIHPNGIIYMVDGTTDRETLSARTEDVFRHVLSHYSDGLRELASLHVFLNFSDHWATSPMTVRDKVHTVAQAFERHVATQPTLAPLRFGVSATHLSPSARSWDDTTRALKKFAADLGS